ncbi:MAG: hypothetical protein M3Q46_03980 [Verrucomicrobiota bacterium]|nr:hypothetical protein [Verrucomicrobiota bacterium]
MNWTSTSSPADFIPAPPGWRERSIFIARHGLIEFFHYDPYGQALSKLQRGHDRDLLDARSLLARGLIQSDKLWEMYQLIEPRLLRYPAIDPPAFRKMVESFCHENR